MSRNDGNALEDLVAQIEQGLLPAGYSVERRSRVYNDSGKQTAEFDIVITGKVGTSKFNYLIECRDRPSEGPAPKQWIEMLMGRRMAHHFDKVMAVSSTGFSGPAIELAKHQRIDLRSVSSLALPEVLDWMEHNVLFEHNNHHLIQCYVEFVNPEMSLQQPKIERPLTEENLLTQGQLKRKSILQLWTEITALRSFWDAVEIDKPPIRVKIMASSFVSAQHSVEIDGRVHAVKEICYIAEVSKNHLSMKLDEAKSYDVHKSDGNGLDAAAHVAQWKGEPGASLQKVTMVLYQQENANTPVALSAEIQVSTLPNGPLS